MKNLELTDITILRELLKDGRRTFTAIAKDCQTSNDSIRGRYKELQKAGVIVGATIQFNFQRFGYTGVAQTMLNVESQDFAETLDRIRKIPDIRSIIPLFNSSFNIAVFFTLKGLSDLDRIKQVVCKQNRINAIRTDIWTDVRNIVENVFADTNEKSEKNPFLDCAKLSAQENPLNVDGVDMQIIDLLALDGRLSFSKIGQQIGVSTATVARKYENLRKNNLIKVSIQVNLLKLGYQSILTLNLSLTDPNEIDAVADELSKIPGVTYILKISGSHDLSVVAIVKDCNGIIEINERILKISNVKGIEANLRMLPKAWPTPRQYISTF